MSRWDRADDTVLVSEAASGNRNAADALLRRHHGRIYAVCRRMCANEADANDATQDAMIAIVRGLARFDGRSSVTTWMYRIATNACLDQLRKQRRRPTVSLDTTSSDDDGPSHQSHELAIESRDGAVDARLTVDAALAKLPDEFRLPVVLRDLADLDYAEIAITLGIPTGTVKSRIARGRMALAEILGNQSGTSQRQTDVAAPTAITEP